MMGERTRRVMLEAIATDRANVERTNIEYTYRCTAPTDHRKANPHEHHDILGLLAGRDRQLRQLDELAVRYAPQADER